MAARVLLPRHYSAEHLCSRCARRRNLGNFAPTIHTREYSYSSRSRYRPGSIEHFYDDLLSQKHPAPQTATPPAPPPKESLPKTEREENLQKARVVFGSRLAGPVERRRDLEAASQRIAGVLVPPRPDEPDNCCMSGCVNCVWDRYRDELEDWAEKRSEAHRRLARQNQTGSTKRATRQPAALGSAMPSHVFNSMDDDGGGSETNWDLGPPASSAPAAVQDLFADIPVGIKEFMRTEKRLKQMKQSRTASVTAA